MKKFFSILVLGLSFTAFAGVMNGGGGKGVVCKNPTGQTQSVELLDLWEARILYQLSITPSPAPVLEQASQALNLLASALPGNSACGGCASKYMQEKAQSFLADSKQVHRLHGVGLELTNDSFEAIHPEGACSIEQLVRYNDFPDGTYEVLINQDLVDKMDLTNQAALVAHEVFYAAMRGNSYIFLLAANPEPSSLRVRRAVGLAMLKHQFHAPDETLPKNYYVCSGQHNMAYLFEMDQKNNQGVTQKFMFILPVVVGGRLVIDSDVGVGTGQPITISDFLSGERQGTTPSVVASLSQTVAKDYFSEFHGDKGNLVASLIQAPDMPELPTEETLPCAPQGVELPSPGQVGLRLILPPTPWISGSDLQLEQSVNSHSCVGIFCDSCPAVPLKTSGAANACSHHEVHAQDLLTFQVTAGAGDTFFSKGFLFIEDPSGQWLQLKPIVDPVEPVGFFSFISDHSAEISIPMSRLCQFATGDASCTSDFSADFSFGWSATTLGGVNDSTSFTLDYKYLKASP